MEEPDPHYQFPKEMLSNPLTRIVSCKMWTKDQEGEGQPQSKLRSLRRSLEVSAKRVDRSVYEAVDCCG